MTEEAVGDLTDGKCGVGSEEGPRVGRTGGGGGTLVGGVGDLVESRTKSTRVVDLEAGRFECGKVGLEIGGSDGGGGGGELESNVVDLEGMVGCVVL